MENVKFNISSIISNLFLLLCFFMPLWPLICSICTILLFLFSGFDFIKRKRKFNLSAIPALYVYLYLFIVLGVAWAYDYGNAKRELQDDLNLLIFPLIFAFIDFNSVILKKAKLGLIAGCVVAGLICIAHAGFNYMETGSKGVFFYSQFSFLLHPTYFGVLLITACIFFAEAFLFTPTYLAHFNKSIFRFGFSFCIILLALLSSKIIYLIAFAILFYFLALAFFNKSYSFIKNKVVISAILGIFIVFFSAIKINNRFAQVVDAVGEQKESYNSSIIRINQIKYSKEVISNNLWLGVGTGDTKPESAKIYKKYNDEYALAHFENPNSYYLHILVMLGVCGLLFSLFVLLFPMWWSYKNKKYMLFAFLLIMLINSFTDIITHATLGLSYAFFSCFLFAEAKIKQD